ncbi:hypothetical protein QTH87_06085 [Variovorax sp. J22P168]|uniref:hypothetical protein n=1 Tax=Variovorax jilinensis TaxID=3053513 RepID=UPI0025783891|nr:hypothetical protein [Variovorax sp. J22P168]MDM0012008.1 hypothetical protein [Variovorax sp. J22P168]
MAALSTKRATSSSDDWLTTFARAKSERAIREDDEARDPFRLRANTVPAGSAPDAEEAISRRLRVI